MAASIWFHEHGGGFMDVIHVRDLQIECIIGTEPKERVLKQKVGFNLALECNLGRACASDRIEDTVNYKTLRDRIVDFVQDSRFELIETLAEKVAQLCLEDRRVAAVTVTLDKPGALTMSRSVAVEIRRMQPVTRRKK
jgi:FolB domain-containing protein